MGLMLAAVVVRGEPMGTVAAPDVIIGKVIGVADGDTLTVLDIDRMPHKIRLVGIDAPERKQAFGTRAKQALSKLTNAKEVRVEWSERDRYGRILGEVFVGDGVDAATSVNEQLVRDGWAWHFLKYSDSAQLAAAEAEAKADRRGLWAEKEPVSPWEWRVQEAARAAGPKAQATEANSNLVAKPQARPAKKPPEPEARYWLNTKSNVRHNAGCEWFGKTKNGRYCGTDEGKGCGICGG